MKKVWRDRPDDALISQKIYHQKSSYFQAFLVVEDSRSAV
jgi:hypothetical protein